MNQLTLDRISEMDKRELFRACLEAEGYTEHYVEKDPHGGIIGETMWLTEGQLKNMSVEWAAYYYTTIGFQLTLETARRREMELSPDDYAKFVMKLQTTRFVPDGKPWSADEFARARCWLAAKHNL